MKENINQLYWEREHGIPVHKADICIHQIIKNIVKIIQWHTAANQMRKRSETKIN